MSYLNTAKTEKLPLRKFCPLNLQTNKTSYTTQIPKAVIPCSLLKSAKIHQNILNNSQSFEYLPCLLFASDVLASEKQFMYDKIVNR